MQTFVLAIGSLMFLFAAVAIARHFRITKATPQLVTTLALAICQFASFIWQMLVSAKPLALLGAALIAFFASQFLFGWSLHSSRKTKLNIVFEPGQPQRVLRSGIFRHIRHPFYLAYFMFWFGASLAAGHWTTIALSLVLVAMLALAARQEEKNFATSPLASDYAVYRKSTGMFLPKFRTSNEG